MGNFDKGAFMIARSILESGIYHKPHLYLKVWLYLIANAQHKEYKDLKRGQLFTSISEIQEACSYYAGYRKITPSKQEICKIIAWLRNPNEGNAKATTKEAMIETTKVTHGMLITICKYNDYQDLKNYEGNSEDNTKVIMKEQRTVNKGSNINKNDKNDKNDKNKIYSSAHTEIIDYLNEKAGKQYKANTDKTKFLITARMNEGFTVEDFKTVIDIKIKEWNNTEWEKFLRPITLFSNKFESYLQQEPKSKEPSKDDGVNKKTAEYFKEMGYGVESGQTINF